MKCVLKCSNVSGKKKYRNDTKVSHYSLSGKDIWNRHLIINK